MLVVKTQLKQSPIHGLGLFLAEPVSKGTLIWRFDSRIDRVYAETELAFLPESLALFVKTYGCWRRADRLWVLAGDDARFVNHADQPTLRAGGNAFDDNFAARDLAVGEELTNDYREVCDCPFWKEEMEGFR